MAIIPFTRIGQSIVKAAKAPFQPEKLQTLISPTKRLLNLGKDVVQGTARSGASVGATISELYGGSNQLNPEGKIQKLIFGNEPVNSLTTRAKEASTTSQELSKKYLGKDIGKIGGASIGLPLVLGMTALDFTGLGGGKKQAAEELLTKGSKLKSLAKSIKRIDLPTQKEMVDVIDYARLKPGYSQKLEEQAGILAEKFGVKSKTLSGVANKFDEILQNQRTIKGAPTILGKKPQVVSNEVSPLVQEAKKYKGQEGFVKIPDTMTSANYNFGKEVPEKIYKSNIRVDKFAVSPEGQNNLARIIQENKGFLEQRRGPQSFEQTQKLADELIPKTRLGKGKALNAEELQSLGDTTAGLQSKVDDLSKRIAAGDNSDNTLLSLAQAKEELTFALASYSGATAEAGRSLSILRNLRKAGLSNDTRLIQDALKLSGGRQQAEDIAKKLVDLGDDNLGKIKFLRDIAKVKTTDKIYEVWLNSVLSNPLTHAVNVSSNTLNALMKVPTRAVEAALQVPGKRKVFFGELPHQVVGALEGLRFGVAKGLYTLKNGITPSQAAKLDIQNLPAIKGITGEVVRLPTKFLSAADEFFKAIIGTSEMRSLAYRQARQEGLKGEAAIRRMHELISNPTKQLYEAVDMSQLKGTFQQPLGKAGQAVMSARNKVPGLKYIIPFIKTPTNIAKEALSYSPLGFAKAIANKDTEAAAKATIGSIMAVPVVMSALSGDITGSAPTNANERDAFYRQGKQPYSIKVGDKWYSYKKLEPLATVIGTIADFTKITDETGLAEGAQQIATIIGKNFNDKTFLSGISNFIEALTDDEKRKDWAANLVSGVVPFSGAQRFATRIIDPTIRKPDGILETLKAQTPGLSDQVPARRDVFGQPSQRTLSQNLSPVGVTKTKTDLVESELQRLKINIGYPSKTIAGQELTREQYNKFAEISGKTLKDVLDGIMRDPSWNRFNDRQKEQVIDRATSKVRERVKAKFFPIKSRAGEIKSRLQSRGLTSDQAQELTTKIVERADQANK